MRRRMCLVGTTLSVVPLALGVTAATAAKSKTSKPKGTPVACKTSVGVMIAPTDTGVTPPVSQGNEYGSVSCGKVLSKGIQSDKFNVPDSGDTVATYTWYFKTGTVTGKYDLIPQEGTLNFLSVNYTGTIKVTNGTGAYKGAKGTGTMKCATADGIHTTCTDKLRLTAL